MKVYPRGWLFATATLTLVWSAGTLAGLTKITGPWAVIVLVVVVVSSPHVIDASRRWLRTVPSPSNWQLDTVLWSFAYAGPVYLPFQPAPDAPRVSDDELLSRAWRASCRDLETATSRRRIMRIVEERSEYLDELERRNPAAFSAWLSSSAAPDHSPLSHLSERRVHPSAINWDELLYGQDDR